MFNILSLIIGVAVFFAALVAFLPLLGWINWLLIPIALIGTAVGVVSRSKAGRNLNLFVLIVCVLRLMLGGGIF